MNLLEVKDIYKEFSNENSRFTAVDHVSLSIDKGECLGIVGESGCGKSTMASLIMHLKSADGGTIIFDGKNLDNRQAVKESRSKMQMIFQNPVDSFDPRYTLLNSVKQGLRYLDTPGKEELDRRAKQAIEYVGLKTSYYDRRICQLSGGECQRAAIARAIISSPELLICDEATSALDVSVQAQIIALLKHLQKEKNMAYLFITHDILLARNICDRIAVMYKGSIVETGMAAEILDDPGHPYTKLLLKCVLKPRIDKEFEFVDSDSLREASSEGCKFYEFCPYATEKCKLQRPELTEKKGRQIACFHEI